MLDYMSTVKNMGKLFKLKASPISSTAVNPETQTKEKSVGGGFSVWGGFH